MGNIRAGTLMKFAKLLIASVSPDFLHIIAHVLLNTKKKLLSLANYTKGRQVGYIAH